MQGRFVDDLLVLCVTPDNEFLLKKVFCTKLTGSGLIQFSMQPQIQAYVYCTYRKAHYQKADFGSHSSSGFIKLPFTEWKDFKR